MGADFASYSNAFAPGTACALEPAAPPGRVSVLFAACVLALLGCGFAEFLAAFPADDSRVIRKLGDRDHVSAFLARWSRTDGQHDLSCGCHFSICAARDYGKRLPRICGPQRVRKTAQCASLNLNSMHCWPKLIFDLRREWS